MSDDTAQPTPDSGQKPSASSSQLTPFFKRDGRPSPLSIGDMNRLVTDLRKFQTLKVNILPAEEDPDGNSVSTGQLLLAGLNAVLELKLSQSQGGGGGGAENVVAMQVVSWSTIDDFLMAKVYSFDGDATGTDLKVALPWLLRSAQSPGGSSPQIWPSYAADDIILALNNPSFGTGVDGASYLAIQDRNWAQRWSYLDGDCNPKHRIAVVGPEETGA